MDGYVSKPICAANLLDEIGRHISSAPAAPAERPAGSPDARRASCERLDRPALLERVDGDPALLSELVELFLEDCPRLLAAVRDAVASGDAEALHRAAHTLKGTLGSLAASAATAVALRLEQMGRAGDLKEAEEACVALEREVEQLKPLLAELRQEVAG